MPGRYKNMSSVAMYFTSFCRSKHGVGLIKSKQFESHNMKQRNQCISDVMMGQKHVSHNMYWHALGHDKIKAKQDLPDFHPEGRRPSTRVRGDW